MELRVAAGASEEFKCGHFFAADFLRNILYHEKQHAQGTGQWHRAILDSEGQKWVWLVSTQQSKHTAYALLVILSFHGEFLP